MMTKIQATDQNNNNNKTTAATVIRNGAQYWNCISQKLVERLEVYTDLKVVVLLFLWHNIGYLQDTSLCHHRTIDL